MEIYIDEFTPETPIELDNNFIYIETLGAGEFGTVVHAKDISNYRECAVKIISKNGKSASKIQKMKKEISILKQLQHKNIVDFLGYTETNSNLYIIMEFIPCGTLKSWLDNNKESIKEEEASIIIEQILRAVQYLHSNEICHRDIKLCNIMLGKKNDLTSLKLIDFGLSAALFNTFEDTEYCGTFLYMAPELIEQKIYSKSVDIWSIGIIMYMLLNHGKHPYYQKGKRKQSYINNIKNSEVKMQYKCSESAKTLLKKLLEVNPCWRYTADKALRHPWITRCTSDQVPETCDEVLKKKNGLKKGEELIYMAIFMNYYSKRIKKRPIYKINAKYIQKANEFSEKKNELIRKERESCLEVISNDSKNSTMKGDIGGIKEIKEKYEDKRNEEVKDKRKTIKNQTINKKFVLSLKQNSKKDIVKFKDKNLNLMKIQIDPLTRKKNAKKELILPLMVSKDKKVNNMSGPKETGKIQKYKEYKPSVTEFSKASKDKINYFSAPKKVSIILKKETKILHNQISRKDIKSLNVVPVLLPTIKISNNLNKRKFGKF